MPRGAQVIIRMTLDRCLMIADIGPGVQVFESGLGSGAFVDGMLRAGPEILGSDVREISPPRPPLKNVGSFLVRTPGPLPHTEVRDTYEGIDVMDMDRVVLDLPEPCCDTAPAFRSAPSRWAVRGLHASVTQAIETRHSGPGRVRHDPDGRGAPAELAHRRRSGAP